MALAETAKLAVQLSLTGNFAKQIGTASKSLDKFGAKLDNTESRAYRAGQQIGTGIKRGAALAAVGVGLIATQVVQGLDSLVELEKQTKQTEAAIKSTGGVAGVTAGEIRAMAEEFEGLNATVGDEVIQSTENLLLSFTNIRKKAFKPALQTILDINTRLGRGPDGLAGTARQVGKALNDPTKGLAALTRIGITFDAKTTKRIKTLQKQGKLFDAQAVILKELQKRFGGAFAAEGGTTAGKVAKFKDAIEDLQRTLAAGLLPVVSNIADALTELFQDPAVQKGVEDFGKQLATFLSPENIKSGIGAIKDVFSTIAAVAGPAAAAVGAMVTAFSKLPPDLRNLLVGAFAVNKLTGGLVTNVAGGLIGALKNLVVPVMNVEAANVNMVGGGGIPGVPGGKGGGSGVLGKVGALGIAGVIIAAAVPIGKAFADALPASLKGEGGKGKSEAQSRLEPLQRPTRVISPSALSHVHEEHVRHGDSAIKKSIDDSKKRLADQINETKRETTRGVNATNATKGAVQTTKTAVDIGSNHVASSVATGSGAIVAAIFAARPVVNVTSVTKTFNNTVRYGAVAGSQGTNSDSGGFTKGH